MIEFGFTSPEWLAKAVVANAHPTLVKKAVVELIGAFHREEVNSGLEAIDRLVQVSAVGSYTPPEPHVHSHTVASFGLNDDGTISEDLTPEQESAVQDFMRSLFGDDYDKEEDDDD